MSKTIRVNNWICNIENRRRNRLSSGQMITG